MDMANDGNVAATNHHVERDSFIRGPWLWEETIPKYRFMTPPAQYVTESVCHNQLILQQARQCHDRRGS